MKIPFLFICIVCISIKAQDQTDDYPSPLPQPQTIESSPPQEELSTGSLHIIAPASDAKIYLDGKLVGSGECTVNDIPIGRHVVFIQDDKREHILEAYTVEGITRTIKVKPDRETFVNVMSTFSNTWCHGVRAYGPSLDIGIQHKDSYFGLNFHWAFFNDWYWGNSNSNGEGFMLGGALLQWYYTVYTYKDIFEVAPENVVLSPAETACSTIISFLSSS